MISFQKIAREHIHALPSKAIAYLDEAINKTPASVTKLGETLKTAAKGIGDIYLVYDGEIMCGAIYMLAYEKILCPVLIGGENIEKWGFRDFMADLAKQTHAEKVRWIGRKGWAALFPEAEIIGHIYNINVN